MPCGWRKCHRRWSRTFFFFPSNSGRLFLFCASLLSQRGRDFAFSLRGGPVRSHPRLRSCRSTKRERERETESKATGRKTSVAMVRDGVFFLSSFFFQSRPSLGIVVSPSKTSLALGLSSRTYLASQAVLEREGKPRRGGRGRKKREKRKERALPTLVSPLPSSLPLSSPPSPHPQKKKSSASSSSCRARARSASASGTSPRRPASARA